jgi:mRNA-degrading endonuclease YafQ of YafQ-DinJ toxin-antitoxin module
MNKGPKNKNARASASQFFVADELGQLMSLLINQTNPLRNHYKDFGYQ